MEKQGKIAAFIESLPMETGIGDCQSTLLVTNMEYLGGYAINGGICVNDSVESCYEASNTKDCRNYKNTCGNSKNREKCYTTDQVPPAVGC